MTQTFSHNAFIDGEEESSLSKLKPKSLPVSSTEMIIITNDTSAVEDFANWKIQKGVPTFVASMSQIKTNYSANGTDPEKVHAFLRDAYSNWGNLTYVLLAGDDYHIPMMRIYLDDANEGWGFSNTLKPTDFYFACLDDANWDDDGDGVFGECSQHNSGGVTAGGPDEIDDWGPDVYVGRIPFTDYDDVETFLELVESYENDPLAEFQSSGWKEFLLAGAILNYDERVNAWNDNDFTDDSELCDYLIDNDIPSNYTTYNYYENRTYFWDYTPTHTYSNLTRGDIISAINNYDPSMTFLAAHGSPTSIYRLIDPSGQPYGERKTVDNTQMNRISGIKVADADNQNGDDEIVAVTTGGAVIVYQGSWENGWTSTVIANLANMPTCVDVGDCDNDGANEIAVGAGPVVYVYEFTVGVGWGQLDNTAENPAADDILCIYIGECEEYDPEHNNEIAVGDQAGQVTLYQWQQAFPPGNFIRCVVYLNQAGDPYPFQQIDCIKGEDFDQNGVRELIFGAQTISMIPDGVFAIQGLFITPQPAFSWILSDIWIYEDDWALSLDTGDPDSDSKIEVVVGTNNGAVHMFQNWTFIPGPGNPPAQLVVIDPNAGSAVEGIAVGDVDENSNVYEVIAGTRAGVLRKYVAAAGGSFYVIDQNMGAVGVDSLAIGYIDDDSEATHLEIAVGTRGGAGPYPIFAYQWPSPYPITTVLYDASDAASSSSNIPALTYVDSCSTAAFDYNAGDSLAEAMLKSGASIAYIGALRLTWYYYGTMAVSLAPGNKGGNRAAAHHFWDAFFGAGSDFRVGSSFYSMLNTYHSTYDTKAAGYHDESWHRKNLISYILLGDPELDIYTNNPDTFTLKYASKINPGDKVDIHVESSNGTNIADAKVCIKGMSFYFVGTTDANGNVSLTLTSSMVTAGEILTITVSKHNFVAKTQQLVVGGGIEISAPQLFYNEEKATIDLYSIIANSTQSSIGMIDDTEATIHSFTIFSVITGNTSVVGELEYDSENHYWYQENISLSSLSNGNYYVRCVFKTNLDPKSIGPQSKTFQLTHTIVVSAPNINYDPDGTLNVTEITAICTYYQIGEINDSEALIYTYDVQDTSGISTGITGNLTWGSDWYATNIDVSSLTVGVEYWVVAYFEVQGANGTSPHSNSFLAGYVIIITSLEIAYDNTNLLLGISNVVATSQNPVYGELDNTEAIDHNYTIFTIGGIETAVSGDLSWSTGTWEASDIDVSSLAYGRYYVICTFTNIDGFGSSSPSEPFRIFNPLAIKITVSKPIIDYDNNNKLLAITDVTATCSNAEHGTLDDTEAVVYSYRIYSESDEINPVLTGDLSYSEGSWSALSINVNSLADGVYFVTCYFEDSDAIGTSEKSDLFIVGYFEITVSAPTISYDSSTKMLSILNVIAFCNNTLHGTLDDSEVECVMYTIYSSEGVSTGITGNLTYNGITWEATDINLGSLADGEYYVVCYFRDSDAEGYSPASVSFGKVNWFKMFWWIFVVVGAVLLLAILLIVVIIFVRKRSVGVIR